MRLSPWLRDPAGPYALAHASKTLFWTVSDIYFAFYLTQACGLSATAMGVLLSTSYFVNAAADWLMGHRLTATVRSARSAAELQLIGGILCSATLLLFGLAALVPPAARLGACLVALMAFRLAYCLYDIPQNSLLALIGGADTARARLAATRLFVSGGARIALSASFVPMFVRKSTAEQVAAFLLLVALMAAAAMLSAAALAWRIRRLDASPAPDAPDAPDAPGAPDTPGRGAPPMLLHAMMLALSFGTTVFTQLEPYLAAFAIASQWQGASLLTAVAIGTAASQPLWMAIRQSRAGAATARIALAMAAAGTLLFPLLALRGGSGTMAVALLYGAGVGGLSFLLWTAVAGHAATRGRTHGVTAILGCFTASAKLGQGFALLAVGMLLERLQPGSADGSAGMLPQIMAAAVGASLAVVAAIGTLRRRYTR